ncbi:helix-turn-helix domain-containing protein [Leucobacter sp. USHLN154]|uniref:helix-turn-helix domain-containing protein n=1 Tax=Leucobacter sp. USHLN154 TaxID=3081269 RepID=UPI00301837DF
MPEQHAAMLEIAKQVNKARQAAGWSQNELADRAGVSRPSVVRVERGDDVNTATLGKIADVLGLTVRVSPQLD